MAKLHMVHASRTQAARKPHASRTQAARKPPWPIYCRINLLCAFCLLFFCATLYFTHIIYIRAEDSVSLSSNNHNLTQSKRSLICAECGKNLKLDSFCLSSICCDWKPIDILCKYFTVFLPPFDMQMYPRQGTDMFEYNPGDDKTGLKFYNSILFNWSKVKPCCLQHFLYQPCFIASAAVLIYILSLCILTMWSFNWLFILNILSQSSQLSIPSKNKMSSKVVPWALAKEIKSCQHNLSPCSIAQFLQAIAKAIDWLGTGPKRKSIVTQPQGTFGPLPD